MSKKILSVIVLLSVLAGYAGAEQNGESFSRLYRSIPDIKQKYSIFQNIEPLDDRTLEPFLTASLNELVYGDLSRYRTDRSTYDDWEILTRAIIRELGDIKAQSASKPIWDVVRSSDAPLLKSEGLISLGMIRSVEYAPEIAVMLRNLNFNTRSDRDNAEIVAYGAIISLEKMRDPVGFEPIFYASVGWYQDRVTKAARNALFAMSEDPTALLLPILKGASNYVDKRSALTLGLQSQAPAEGKTNLAVEGLREGLKYAEADATRKKELENLRVDSIAALVSLETTTSDSPSLLNIAVDRGQIDEKLIAIQALGVDAGDPATRFLSERLALYNQRQAAGLVLNREEITLVRQLVFALGEAGNTLGLPVLQEMNIVGYTPAVLRLADEAKAKINGK